MIDTINSNDLFCWLEQKYNQFNCVDFIDADPISIPHQFKAKNDIEISAFLISIMAWGNRTAILKSGNNLMELMDFAPFDFVLNHQPVDLKRFDSFVYRTLNASDLQFLISSLQHIYINHNGLESAFFGKNFQGNAFDAITQFRTTIFSLSHLVRTEKHISNPAKNSASKRLNMFLRWMVRADDKGVDFGIWDSISPDLLICPLDIHSARVARNLGLLSRCQNDRKAAEELTQNLSYFCPQDPVKYDFALFGAGVNGIL